MVQDRDRRTWCSIAEAARRLGISERAVRKRIDAGRLEARRETVGNRVRTVVAVPAAAAGAASGSAEVRDLAAQIARLEERLAASEAARDELERVVAAKDAHLGELRIALDVERARVNMLIERPRRRWWWRRGGG